MARRMLLQLTKARFNFPSTVALPRSHQPSLFMKHISSVSATRQNLHVRSFNVCSTRSSESLVSVLQREINFEKESKKDTTIPSKINDFSVEEDGAEVLLKKSLNGESISVSFSVNEQAIDDSEELDSDESDEGDEEEEEDTTSLSDSLDLSVSVEKGGKTLKFEIRHEGGDFSIKHVSFYPTEDVKDSDYDGPVFDHLDEDLQNAFYDYLADRSIDSSLTEKLIELYEDKEETLYGDWLKNIRDFVKA